jgi:chitinase
MDMALIYPREYPAADDRSGRPQDFQNYVSFLQNLRNALDATGRHFGLSITIVSQEVSTGFTWV